jgi:GNAT superfamily N-acetyltransferase
VRRDLSRVADLVEQCFSDTLDPDGQRYLGQMRAAANNPAYLRWAGAAAERVSLPLSGYVWEEDNQIVGNLNLIPFYPPGRRLYLIANVAVRPDHRRRGIARSLTARAMEHARRKGSEAVWLHVRAENTGAVQLYRSLGFQERARRSTWHSTADLVSPPEPSETSLPRLTFRQRLPAHWPQQQAWLQETYPPELAWHLSINFTALRPGFLGGLYRFFTDNHIRQWSLLRGDRLLGALAYQPALSFADSLWLACSPEEEDLAVGYLLSYARRRLSPRRPLSLDYPAGRAVGAITDSGFSIHQTLMWMAVSFQPGK